MNRMYENLEFNTIKEDISKRCSFSLGVKEIMDTNPHYEPLWVNRELLRGREALKLYRIQGSPSFAGVSDLTSCLKDVRKGRVLDERELYSICELSRALYTFKNYKKSSEITCESIWDLIDSLSTQKRIIDEVEECIAPNYYVLDSASNELHSIRKSINATEMEINKATTSFMSKYSNSLMENIITSRNGRTCVLVKNSDKYKIKGIIHGESASGLAVYIEPEVLLRLNNQLASLYSAEQDEIYQIRKELSDIIKPHANELIGDIYTFALLDALFAKANWALEKDGMYAILSNKDRLYYKNARHPLIDQDKVVSNTYKIESPYRHLLISGSNTGGKTVTLKTIGLFTLLTLSGFPILCDEAEVPCFNGIYSDIGDAQSIIESLSTFSAHLKTLSYICKKANDHSLVLLDELGSGTDPQEGECLAIATLEYFRAHKIMSVTTTHYTRLKEYAKKQEDILLSSVGFDMHKMMPTYHYIEGYSGSSNALQIAKRYNLNREIVDKAMELKEEGKSDVQLLIEKLDQQSILLQQKEEKIKKGQVDLNKSKQQYLNEKRKFEEEKEKILNEARKEADKIKEEAREEANEIIEELHALKNKNIKEHEIIELKSRLNVEDEEENEESEQTFKVHDYVRMKNLGYHGEIISLKNNRAVVLVNGMRMNVKTNELELGVKPNSKPIVTHSSRLERKPFNREVNLLGMRVDEALSVVDKYLDSALMNRMYTVRIIHGHGTGALRNAIQNYLKKNPRVESYRYGGEGEGGLGATVVNLKHGDK